MTSDSGGPAEDLLPLLVKLGHRIDSTHSQPSTLGAQQEGRPHIESATRQTEVKNETTDDD